MFKGLGRRKRTNSSSTTTTTTEGAGAMFSIEIDAPSDVVWGIVTNVASHDKVYSTCSEVKNLNPRKSLNPVEPGAKYLEKRRLFHGKPFEFVSYVTVVDHEAHIYAEATSFFHCTATMTTRLEDLDGNRCRLLGTYGMVPDGFWGRMYLWRNRNRMERNDQEEILSDLRDIKHAAETGRYRKDSNSSDDPRHIINETNDTSSSDHVDFVGKEGRS